MNIGYATRLVGRPTEGVEIHPTAKRPERTPATPPLPAEGGKVAETEVVCRRQWRNLVAQLHREPDRVGPTMVASVPQTQLILQLSGALHLTVDHGGRSRHAHRTGPGTLFLTPANLPDFEIEWVNLSPEPVRMLLLYLDNDLLAQAAAADAGLDAGIARLELRNGTNLEDPLLRQLAYAVAGELQQPESQTELYADTTARMLAAQLVRRHGTVTPKERASRFPTLSPQCMRRLNDYVRTHLKESITLDGLAAVAGLSPYHFCRAFRRTVGQSPYQYVIAQRLARAAHLLGRTRLTVAHVASEVGYQSVPHFSLLFARHVGCPPAAFGRCRLDGVE